MQFIVHKSPYCQQQPAQSGQEILLSFAQFVCRIRTTKHQGYMSRFRVDRVNPAATRQTHKQFWRPPGRLQIALGAHHKDSRVFLAVAILTLVSFWGRVILACYTGTPSIVPLASPPSLRLLFSLRI
ncbi:hypothetical protein PoB_006584000 [Plakobranchus ocellatus]|uniref:Uncharacterized protein n=1 Tax=Plakobranchus ocellatus TaxID=259542 RepID=A0AAV4D5G1_9GAST|nr:hypothetical protein PoB_006584000 [Plakobranchus ocellatus]